MDDLTSMSLAKMALALRNRTVSSRELVEESLRRIARLNAGLNAFITITDETALAEAVLRDHELASGIDRGPLHGIPIAHKDLVRTKGVRTTAGSKIFADYIPARDAVIASQLHEIGRAHV